MSKTFWAQIVGLEDEVRPCCMMGCDCPREAAEEYAGHFIEETEGDWIEGAIRVWAQDAGPKDSFVFDIVATITACEDEGAEEGEVDCLIEVTERG